MLNIPNDNSLAYDKDGKLLGNFDGEFIYSQDTGTMLPFRVDGDEIYSMDANGSGTYIGDFEDDCGVSLNGELIFKLM